YGAVQPAAGGLAKQTITVQQGIETEKAKEIVKLIKDRKLKVQAQIQADQVRVTGKNRDDLQTVIQLLKQQDMDLPLQFTNLRDFRVALGECRRLLGEHAPAIAIHVVASTIRFAGAVQAECRAGYRRRRDDEDLVRRAAVLGYTDKDIAIFLVPASVAMEVEVP